MIRTAFLSALGSVLIFAGCACHRSAGRSFKFPADGFAFPNELRWHYEFGDSGSVITRKNEPAPAYSLRCFPMVRAAREFFYHAEFHPELPAVGRDEYIRLTRAIIHRNSRCPAPPGERIVVPGFRDLHAFSAAWGDVFKNECGSASSSFFQRGNWRMVFPVLASTRRRTAERFLKELNEGQLPIAHIYRFPDTTLNHAILLYAARLTDSEIVFSAYDPNDPSQPAVLTFDRASRSFSLQRTPYFAGGPVKAYEVYRGLFY